MCDVKGAAYGILKGYIDHALCIDDEFVGMYSGKTVPEIESELYTSFSKSINGFVKMRSYDPQQDYKQDIDKTELLVIDWQLDENEEIKFYGALRLIEEAISSKCPLVCIYTQESREIQTIYKYIYSYFIHIDCNIKNTKNELAVYGIKYNLFKEQIEKQINIGEEGDLIDAIKEYKKEYRNNLSDNSKDSHIRIDTTQIKNDLIEIYWSQEYNIEKAKTVIDKNSLSFIYKDNGKGLKEISAINIRGKIICVVGKSDSSSADDNSSTPEELLMKISDIVYQAPNNMLNVIWLSYLTKLRKKTFQKSAFGNTISEGVLKHLLNSAEADDGRKYELFSEKLLNHFKEDITYLIANIDPEIDERIIKYIEANEDEVSQEEIIKFNSLNAMNVVYDNTIHHLSFGDIFYVAPENSNHSDNKEAETLYLQIADKVLVCITAHCDCAHCCEETKSKNSFSFAVGEKLKKTSKKMKESISNPEADSNGLYDFIEHNGKPYAVKWDNYITNIYVKNADKGFKNGKMKGIYKNCEVDLEYVGNLKENYTQRIANKLYSYANRVGISYLKFM